MLPITGLPATSRPTNVSQINEAASSSDSDHSDSEIGAVGGARQFNLSKENPLLSLPRSSAENLIGKQTVDTEGQSSSKTNNNSNRIVDAAVIEVTPDQGLDNSGFVVDGEGEESDEDSYHGDDVVFVEGGKKDEKKSNGII